MIEEERILTLAALDTKSGSVALLVGEQGWRAATKRN
jgi:hypothetical protein